MQGWDTTAERRALKRDLLAVTVLHGVDLRPADDGVVLRAGSDRLVTWAQCRQALGTLPPGHPVAPDVLARCFRTLLRVAAVPDLLLGESARVVGLPVGHVRHPGLAWVVERVHGDALDLGLGFRGLDQHDADRVVVVPPLVWDVLDSDPLRWWWPAREGLEQLGLVAVERLLREPQALRPVGDADVVTLLGARGLRAALAEREGGLAAVAVPMLRRGWTSLSLLDPAFVPAAALATPAAERGFERPVLVTTEEVASVPAGDWARQAALDGRLPAADVAPLQRRWA